MLINFGIKKQLLLHVHVGGTEGGAGFGQNFREEDYRPHHNLSNTG